MTEPPPWNRRPPAGAPVVPRRPAPLKVVLGRGWLTMGAWPVPGKTTFPNPVIEPKVLGRAYELVLKPVLFPARCAKAAAETSSKRPIDRMESLFLQPIITRVNPFATLTLWVMGFSWA